MQLFPGVIGNGMQRHPDKHVCAYSHACCAQTFASTASEQTQTPKWGADRNLVLQRGEATMARISVSRIQPASGNKIGLRKSKPKRELVGCAHTSHLQSWPYIAPEHACMDLEVHPTTFVPYATHLIPLLTHATQSGAAGLFCGLCLDFSCLC